MSTAALLYDFRLYDRDGVGATLLNRWTYTNAERDITGVPGFTGLTFASDVLTLGRTSHDAEDQSQTAEVVTRRDFPIAGLFIGGQPAGKLYCSIYRYSDLGLEAVWVGGKVKGCAWTGLEAKLRVDSLKSRAARKGLRLQYRATCGKALYSVDIPGLPGSGCGVDKATWARTGTVTALSADGRTVTTTLSEADGFFKSGLFEALGYQRTVLNNVGGVLTLVAAIPGLTVGAAITAYRGCDRSKAACQAFGNFARFGGHPTVPVKNPYERPLTQ